MSPRPRDTAVRAELLRAAALVLAEEGQAALSTRRLAEQVGVSTRAVYTYFGGMEALRRELRRDGFARLEELLDARLATGDPVTDLAASALAFYGFGIEEPQVYRALFVDRPVVEDDTGVGTFERLLRLADRAVTVGRFAADDPVQARMCAAQVWSMSHGLVTMVHSGGLSAEQARAVVADTMVRLAIGYGDEPGSARDSVRRAEPAREGV